MAEFVMPAERDFGWALKPTASTQFGIFEKPNGQFLCGAQPRIAARW